MPFGRKEAYAEEMMKTNLKRLTYLIKVCSFLSQIKVYIFWKMRNWAQNRHILNFLKNFDGDFLGINFFFNFKSFSVYFQ